MPAFLVVGYKTMDLGIFSAKDPRLAIIKRAIRRDLVRLFEDGVDWLIFQGNLGFEAWCLEVAMELKDDYGVQLATIFPFADQGQSWSEANQLVLERFRQVDYVNHSFATYENPGQLRQHQEFLLKNSQGVYLFYDPEQESKLSYFDQKIKELGTYEVLRLDFDRLNDLAQEES